ncbi:MAG: hypothetical protein KZQ83_12490 [gamma proteobacterium symbiont of Taylorina sp.]|nr:hypothetical protein [gamma proteobacterium symbiont of Taylorina sp.]
MPTQTQQTDPSDRNQNIPFNPLRTASVGGRNVLLSTDKNYLFTPGEARHLAQQL